MSHFFVLHHKGALRTVDQQEIMNRVRELIDPFLRSRQVELVEFHLRQEGGRLILRFLVDTPRWVTLDGLSQLNHAIGALLDEHDAIPQSYMLEVSSPGLDRSLKTQADFERVIGRRLKVSTNTVVHYKREHSGELISVGEEAIILESDTGEKVRIRLNEIAHAVQEIKI